MNLTVLTLVIALVFVAIVAVVATATNAVVALVTHRGDGDVVIATETRLNRPRKEPSAPKPGWLRSILIGADWLYRNAL